MLFRAIAKFVRARGIRSLGSAVRSLSYDALQAEYDAARLNELFQQDLANCFSKNPSVIQRDYLLSLTVVRVWEMYHSSNGNVYCYYPPSGERRIYTK